MRKLLTTLSAIFFAVACLAQSDVQFTHFMYNKLSYNPAFTGAKGTFDAMGLYRNQWNGIEGAPETMNLSVHTPFAGGRNAIGGALTIDQIGKVRTTAVDLFYAYHIPVSESAKLSIGLNGRLENARLDWRKADPLDLIDESIPGLEEGASKPNFGLGAYYYTDKYFFGVSAPRLLKNTLFLNRDDNTIKRAEALTYYGTAGTWLRISSNVKLAPTVLMTFNPNAPVDIDFNANIFFLENFMAGMSYRLGDSLDGLFGFQFNNGLRLGMAVDFTTSDLEKATNGSWEIMLGYTFKCKDCNVNHLRYF